VRSGRPVGCRPFPIDFPVVAGVASPAGRGAQPMFARGHASCPDCRSAVVRSADGQRHGHFRQGLLCQRSGALLAAFQPTNVGFRLHSIGI